MTVACYARKSNDNVNESISHQLDIINSYLLENKEFLGADILYYTDDGQSGISTDRPQFQELLTKVRERLIDVIVVKDLSRLSRNYLDVCKLTDSIFPFMGVRLIAIADNYDSNVKQQTLIDLGTAFKAILDEYYVIENSEKVRAAFDAKIRSGQFIGSMPYGYYRADKYTAVIDEKKADIVTDIFDMFVQGKSTSQIAGILNSVNADNRSWNVYAIRRIIKSECYIGKRVSLTYRRNVKLKRNEYIDPKDWYVDESAYPPIIDKETFEQAQKMRRVNKKTTTHKEPNILARKLICANCGRTLSLNAASYKCRNGYRTGRKSCFEGNISKSVLFPAILTKVKDYIRTGMSMYDLNFSFSNIVSLNSELEKLRERKAMVFETFVDERMSEEQFRSENDRISVAISEKKKELERCRRSAALKSKYKKERLIDTLRRLAAATELTREHMMFVERITVFDKDHFEVIMQKDSPLTVLCRNMDIYEEEFL